MTLTGTGGVGKTRLALELADRSMPDAPDGVWWVDLAAARNEADALAALAASAAAGPGRVRRHDVKRSTAVASVLGEGAAVLVVDNCEQLLDAIAPIVEELLGFCPQIRVVATSREALRIPGELLFDVVPLAPRTRRSTLFEERIAGIRVDGERCGPTRSPRFASDSTVCPSRSSSPRRGPGTCSSPRSCTG